MTQPAWTERADKRGLDPLGIQNPGVALYQQLIPGISNVTLRVRYYGFYCWTSEAYAKTEASTDEASWRRWVRRSEAAYALIASMAGGEGGVGGIDWADRRLSEGEDVIDFAQAASDENIPGRYLAQGWGVFGGAYYTQMVEMGIFVMGDFGIQRAHNVAGVALAAAFRQSIGPEVEALLLDTIRTAKVSRADLDRLHPAAPSKIPEESDERLAYEGLLFARVAQLAKDESRARSLRLILDTAGTVGSRPTVDQIRFHLFFGHFEDEKMESQRVRWEAYQCQDLFQVAAAALLEWSTRLMDADGGVTIEMIQLQAQARLATLAGATADLSWQQFRGTLDPLDFDFQLAWSSLIGRRGSVEEKAWLAVNLMAAIEARVASRPDLDLAVRRELSVRGNARSVVSELDWLSRNGALNILEVCSRYLADRIIRRHSWVAMQKLRRQRDYTFLFEIRDGRFIRRNGYAPAPTTPRLGPSVQFLEDIGLVTGDGLTQSGLGILERVA